MLENVESIFEDMQAMMKRLKKASYEEHMKEFRDKKGHFFTEMTSYVEGAEDREKATDEVANVFVERVRARYALKGKINGRIQADLNFFMIFYTFPAILLTESPVAKDVADTICEKWRKSFKDSNISYTSYDKIYEGFRNKIFGIF